MPTMHPRPNRPSEHAASVNRNQSGMDTVMAQTGTVGCCGSVRRPKVVRRAIRSRSYHYTPPNPGRRRLVILRNQHRLAPGRDDAIYVVWIHLQMTGIGRFKLQFGCHVDYYTPNRSSLQPVAEENTRGNNQKKGIFSVTTSPESVTM